MTRKLLAIVAAATFVSGAASAATTYVGGNRMPQYKTVAPSKNTTVTKNAAGGNAAHAYGKVEVSKNRSVSKYGAGGNAMRSYPSTSKQ